MGDTAAGTWKPSDVAHVAGPVAALAAVAECLTLVIAVHVATIGSTLGTAWLFPIERRHWIVAAVLVGLGIVHLELSRNIERLRAKEAGAGPFYDFKTVWNVAALLLLPPLLATAVIISTHLYGFVRVHRRDDNKAHRWAYSCSTVVLATQAAAVVLALGTHVPRRPGPDGVRRVAGGVRRGVHALAGQLHADHHRQRADAAADELQGRVRPVRRADQRGRGDRTGDPRGRVDGVRLPGVVGVRVPGDRRAAADFLLPPLEAGTPFDQVTGVYSRTSFIEQAETILERARFRGDNGRLPAAGHGLLQAHQRHPRPQRRRQGTGARWPTRCGTSPCGKDIPGRWGGEEFVGAGPRGQPAGARRGGGTNPPQGGLTPLRYPYKDPVTDEATTRTVA